jgi:hypothetical protein
MPSTIDSITQLAAGGSFHQWSVKLFHPTAAALFALATLTSVVRLDYNVILGLVAFFFVQRPRTRFNFSADQNMVFLRLCAASLVTDLMWIIGYANASSAFAESSGEKALAGAAGFAWVVALLYFWIKLPLIGFLASIVARAHVQRRTNTSSRAVSKVELEDTASQPLSLRIEASSLRMGGSAHAGSSSFSLSGGDPDDFDDDEDEREVNVRASQSGASDATPTTRASPPPPPRAVQGEEGGEQEGGTSAV